MDNGSGLAVALEVARRMKDGGSTLKRGLRVIFFTFEEWALIGSQLYIQGLSQEEREKIALVINLDTVVGSPKLTALVSGHIEVANFIKAVTKQAGVPVQPILPLQPNSDHYNFYLAGVPSLRLIAGYEDSSSLTRFLLTPADTRDKVDPGQLRLAAMTTLSLVFEACSHSGVIARHLSPEQLNHQLDASDPWVADRT
jgi:Zn-dependent M28 family amino/carboxypeptidase